MYVHIIPRKVGDFLHNDEIYKLIEKYDEEFIERYKALF